MKKILLPILSLLIFLTNADARFWTNKEGKTFEGELVEVKDNAVTIRRNRDRIKFTMNVADLSQADQDYLKELKEKKKAEEEKKRLKGSLPKTKEELAKWIAGTEWGMREPKTNSGKEGSKMVRRFLPDGVMLCQSKILKWDKSRDPGIVKYRILSKNSIVYGTAGWTIVFDKKFKSFTGKSANNTLKCSGTLVERFMQF